MDSTSQIKLTNHEYSLISSLVYDRFGIILTEKKKSLIVSRLHKILVTKGFSSFKEFYNHIISDKSGESLGLLIDKISTNYTYFFRENDHFTYLSTKVFPEIKNKINSDLLSTIRIWSAGCSSGEEAYTLAMLLDQFFGIELARLDAGILGTDISSKVLEVCKAGVYSQERVSPLPIKLKNTYLNKNGDDSWVFNARVKKLLLFKRLNLMREDYPFQGKFDVIFCRNVMIYFDSPTRDDIVRRFARYLNPNGYLFIGHSETLGRNNKYFRYLQPATYQKIN